MPGFQRALERYGEDISVVHILTWLRSSAAFLFVTEGVKCGVVVRAEQWGPERVLRILAITGHDIEEWLPGLVRSDEWKAYLGDMPIVFEGRKGWERVIPNVKVIRTLYRLDSQ